MLRCAFNIVTCIRGAYDVYLCPGGIYLLIPSKKKRSARCVHALYFENVQHTTCLVHSCMVVYINNYWWYVLTNYGLSSACMWYASPGKVCILRYVVGYAFSHTRYVFISVFPCTFPKKQGKLVITTKPKTQSLNTIMVCTSSAYTRVYTHTCGYYFFNALQIPPSGSK